MWETEQTHTNSPPFRGWNGGKRSDLRLEILSCLATDGKISKKYFQRSSKRSSGTEVGHAFDWLEKQGIILAAGKAESIGGGRKKQLYRLTTKGLYILADETKSAGHIWQALVGISHIEGIDKQTENFVDWYVLSCLKYEQGFLFFVYIDTFDEMCEEWENLLGEDYASANCILEQLAKDRRMTVRTLASKCNLSEDRVKKVLDLLHPRGITEGNVPSNLGISINLSTGFLPHLCIKAIEMPGYATNNFYYELSTVGLLRYLYYVGTKGKQGGKEVPSPNSVMNISQDFKDACDIVAKSYPEKMPLIFRVWQSLKVKSEWYSAAGMLCLVDRQARKNLLSIMVSHGGTVEIFEDVKQMSDWKHRELGDFLNNGINALAYTGKNPVRYLPDGAHGEDAIGNGVDSSRTGPLYEKLADLYALYGEPRMPFNPEERDKVTMSQLDKYREKLLRNFEDSFAKGCSFLFYLGMVEHILRYGATSDENAESKALIEAPTATSLRDVLKLDEEIAEFLRKWLFLVIAFRNVATSETEKRLAAITQISKLPK